jgi:hypothetical protein
MSAQEGDDERAALQQLTEPDRPAAFVGQHEAGQPVADGGGGAAGPVVLQPVQETPDDGGLVRAETLDGFGYHGKPFAERRVEADCGLDRLGERMSFG